MQVVIELPGIRAISRNETTGHFINYYKVLTQAERWMWAHGKSKEYHFEKRVDILIEAYIDTVNAYQAVGKTGKLRTEYANLIDAPNVDDKIFTDTLNRYKTVKVAGKLKRIERDPWFIQDDKPEFVRLVAKRVYPANHYKIVITITEVEDVV